MPGQPASFDAEYFAECDEHLAAARQSVLTLEMSLGTQRTDTASLDDLFRSFHSIKGLSAMVGIAEAERLAHAMESLLGSLRRGHHALTAGGLAALADGVRTLEAAIEARRQGGRAMDVTPAVAAIAVVMEEGQNGGAAAARGLPIDLAQVHLTPPERARLETAVAGGDRARCFAFAPSQILAERGVDVGTVRKRLEELGEIVHASPQVGKGGTVAFAFVVATKADTAVLQALADDGITLVEYDALAAVEAVPAAEDEILVDITRPRANLVRVDLAKLDNLMRMVGELVVTRGRLEQTLRRAGAPQLAEHRALHETNASFERQLRELREAVMRVRLVPVREVFERMRFVVRDLTRGTDKIVEMELVGQDTEVDKLVVERLTEPLLHLVRNAVSHGLEPAKERTALGKPAEGHLALRSSSAGETVVIEIEDDGRGIDLAQVRSRAIAAGLIDANAEMTPAVLLDVLSTPGFSTRDEVDRASGRGVGMGAVRTAIEELNGSLELTTSPSAGTCFTIRVPLSLAILDALIVRIGDQRFAAPRTAVREVLRIERTNIMSLAADEILHHRGEILPLVRLSRTFNMADSEHEAAYVLVVQGGDHPIGLVVDGIEGLREIVVRPLVDPLVRQRGIGGATELGDRRAVLILDTKSLADRRSAEPVARQMSRSV